MQSIGHQPNQINIGNGATFTALLSLVHTVNVARKRLHDHAMQIAPSACW